MYTEQAIYTSTNMMVYYSRGCSKNRSLDIVSKKDNSIILFITSPDINQFSKFIHHEIQ